MKKQRKSKPGKAKGTRGPMAAAPMGRSHLDGLGSAARAFASGGPARPATTRAAPSGASWPRANTDRPAALGDAARAFLRNGGLSAAQGPARSSAPRGRLAVAAADDRAVLALLLAPVFLLAFALAANHALKPSLRIGELAHFERAPQPVARPTAPTSPSPTTAERAPSPAAVPSAPVAAPPISIAVQIETQFARAPKLALPQGAPLIEPPPAVVVAAPAFALPAGPPTVPAPAPLEIATPSLRLPASPPVIEAPAIVLAAPAFALPTNPPNIPAAEIVLAAPAFALPAGTPWIAPEIVLAAPRLVLPAGPPAIPAAIPAPIVIAAPGFALPATPPVVEAAPVILAEPRLAMPGAQAAIPAPPSAIARLPATPPRPLPPAIAQAPPSTVGVCRAEDGRATLAAAPGANSSATGTELPPNAPFGDRLAAAAVAQTGEFVVYNDQYRRISYPMGDVSPLFGVCTDVVIRAYRSLGIDLQAEVQTARVGSGDTSIDHRRTETLRRFLATRGQSLPVTSFAEDYQPGDVVTYHRPQNRRSRSHIAIVSDRVGPSGRLMIVHNRGWGPQLEDALFVDQITGHYRYGGPEAATALVAAAPRNAAQRRKLAAVANGAPGRPETSRRDAVR